MQSDQSLCLSFEYSMSVKLLTQHHLKFLSLKGGCTGSSESTLVKMTHCWKSHVTAHLYDCLLLAGFPQALEIMENLENQEKSSMHGKIMEF